MKWERQKIYIYIYTIYIHSQGNCGWFSVITSNTSLQLLFAVPNKFLAHTCSCPAAWCKVGEHGEGHLNNVSTDFSLLVCGGGIKLRTQQNRRSCFIRFQRGGAAGSWHKLAANGRRSSTVQLRRRNLWGRVQTAGNGFFLFTQT